MGRSVQKCIVLFIGLFLLAGCHRKTTTPVPGSRDSADASAFRVIADAQAALHSIKTWEVCADAFAAGTVTTVTVDGKVEACDPGDKTFPAAARPALFKAEQTYNVAVDLGKQYHEGLTGDQQALNMAASQLGKDINDLLVATGGRKK